MPKALTGRDGPEGNSEAPVATAAGRRAENLPLDMRSCTGAVTRNSESCGVTAAARGAPADVYHHLTWLISPYVLRAVSRGTFEEVCEFWSPTK
jgi:hypothetical protein